MRWQLGLLGLMGLVCLIMGLSAPGAQAQIVYRDKVTTTQLSDGADLIVLGEVVRIENVGSSDHQGVLIQIEPDRVLKGPEEPGQIQIFNFTRTTGTLSIAEGEKPLLFLTALDKSELECAHCDKKGFEVIDLPDGNYYVVRASRWGLLMPGSVYVDHVAATIRLKTKGDYSGLKNHWMNGAENPDGRIALDSVIDLLAEEKALANIDATDSAAILRLVRTPGDRFRPVDPLVLLAGHTGLPEALASLIDLARSPEGPETAVLASSLTLLSVSGVDVASALEAELASPGAEPAEKERFILVAASMKERKLTDALIALVATPELRKSALLALGDMKDPKALPTLQAGLTGGEMKFRQAAAVALAYFGGDGVKAIMEYQKAHPEDDLARFIGELRRNPARVRGQVR
ncbi:MAG: HEAT repeat domain-containing protein [Planctomycetota bacterium]|nr:HEAT repeat domain-containing protein [Planctomycetota bacterium]